MDPLTAVAAEAKGSQGGLSTLRPRLLLSSVSGVGPWESSSKNSVLICKELIGLLLSFPRQAAGRMKWESTLLCKDTPVR